MKPIFYSPLLAISLAASALTSCEKKATAPAATDAVEAESQKASAEQAAREEALHRERASIEEERRQAALDKAEAQRLRDESEDLRAEAELRQSISKLADEADREAKEVTPKIASTTSEPEPIPEITPVPETVTYEPFYNDLADDGQWMDSSDYGYVWQPTISTRDDWAPYTDGSWSYTDYGWAWDSRESFGSICYHYGRWTRLRNIGWVWVPGHDWAPAWVSWRTGDDCIGWAPLPPAARWHRNLGIHGWVDATCHISPVNYCFVKTREIFHPHCREVILPRRECEERFLRSRNVTALTEVKKPGSPPIVRCDGPPVDKLKEHFRGAWRERRINFHGDAVATNKPRVQTEDDGIPMRQWSLRPIGENRHARPKVVAKELPPALDVTPVGELKNPGAIKRLLASEASTALQQSLPPAANRGPRARIVEVAKQNTETPREVAATPKPTPPQAGSPPAQPSRPAPDHPRKMRDREGKSSAPPAEHPNPAVVSEQPEVPTAPTTPDLEKSNQDPAKAREMAEANARELHLREQQIAENQKLEEAARLREIKRQASESSNTPPQNGEKEIMRQREMAQQQKHREAESLALEKIQEAELQRLEEDRKRKMELSLEQQAEKDRHLEMAKQKDLEARQEQEVAQRAEIMREKQDAVHQAELARKQELAEANQQQQEARRAEIMREKQDAAHQAELAQQQALAQARREQEAAQRAEAMREKQEAARQAEIARQQEMAQARKEQETAQRAEAMREKQEAARQAEIARQQEMAQARKEQETAQRAEAMREKQEAARQAEIARQQEMAQARREQEAAQRAEAMREKQGAVRQAEIARQQEMAQARRQQEEARRAEAERHQKEAAERARGDGGRNSDKKGPGR